ncbi:AraC family transcriptional regulator [Kordiimonas sp. SCSIO 12610]|uniref:helix-turn-helix domain-containing protein n=1 Tax=Kordiimonas sp. SCSIO 12610 TaxID=2829597 RepID=UPI00210B1ED9|nr:AraC family transcriptional regulator [Kordiimonas sp. SCSIO 12610]UTW56588.1 helix-turn-helix transcriptional regulator [Kordiimonas sp. SCSIO 12610]
MNESVTFSLFDILIIIGLVQGIITAFLLLATKEQEYSKRILGIVILAFCLANFKVLLHTTGLWNVPVMRYFPAGSEVLLPPLIYLYVKSLTQDNYAFTRIDFFHLVPALVYGLYDTAVYFAVLGEDTAQAKLQISNQLYFDLSNQIEDYLVVIISIFYMASGLKRIKTYLKWLTQFNDYKSLVIYKWLRTLMVWSFCIVGVLAINQTLTAMSLAMDQSDYRWRFFNLLLAFVTYYIGFMGYKNDSLRVHTAKNDLKTLANKLSNNQIQEIALSLRSKLEEEKIFLDGELTLKQLASNMNVSSESLSFVVNQKFNMSFRDLLNQYRIEQVKIKLSASKKEGVSILNIALDSGFNSQASFYRAFKKSEGLTPKEFINRTNIV